MDKDRYRQQGLQLHVPDHQIVLFADTIQCGRCFIWSEGSEQDLGMSVLHGRADIVLHVLGMTGNRVVRVTVKDLVQLKDIVARDRDGVKALVNDGKNVAVPGDLLLAAVTRRRLLFNELPDARIRGHDAFYGVGGLGTLDLGDLHQFFQFLRSLLQIQLLLPGFFIDSRHQAKHF